MWLLCTQGEHLGLKRFLLPLMNSLRLLPKSVLKTRSISLPKIRLMMCGPTADPAREFGGGPTGENLEDHTSSRRRRLVEPPKAARGGEVWGGGCAPSPMGRGLGRGCAPPQKIFLFLACKYITFQHIRCSKSYKHYKCPHLLLTQIHSLTIL